MTAHGRGGNKATVDPKLLELLACPLTKGPLAWDAERGELVSRLAKLAYPVRDGIPIMLPSEARTLTLEDAPPPRKGTAPRQRPKSVRAGGNPH